MSFSSEYRYFHSRVESSLEKDFINKRMKNIILEFSECFRIDGWSPRDGQINDGPAMLKGEFMVNRDQMTNGIARDSFLDLSGWLHGVVFVNGFNLGRYFKGGPQKSLYVPGPILKEGSNEVKLADYFS